MKTERTQIHFLSDVLVAVASLDLKFPIVSGEDSRHDMVTIVNGLCYWKKFLCLSLFQFHISLFPPLQEWQFCKASLIPSRITWPPYCHSLRPVRSILQRSHIPSLFCSFSLLLSASVLVVIPFRTGSYQTTSTRWATLVPVSVGLIIRVRMPLDVTQGMAAPDNSHVSPKFVNDVLNGSKTADISMLAFRDPSAFMVGNSHGYLPSWQRIASVAPYDRAQDALKWSGHRVDEHQVFFPLREITRDSLIILISLLIEFSIIQFPVNLLLDLYPVLYSIGQLLGLSLFGEGSVRLPPHLVMPLTVEPTKPRLCNDNRFLNLWVKDTPVNLDSIAALPRYVQLKPDTPTQQPAGILGVTLYLSGGNPQPAIIILLVFLPCIIFAVSLFLILCTYIDNRHTGELKLPLPTPTFALFTSDRARSFAFASSASFIVCLTLVCLGYYINLAKTILVPREVVQYLSFLVDSCKQAFLLLEEKRQKLTFCL